MLSQEILDLYKKSRLMTYRAMFGRIREKSGSLSATDAYAVDVIYLLGSPTITQLAETLGIGLAVVFLEGVLWCRCIVTMAETA